MKNGQIAAQPFIIIFSLLVAAMLLAWGIKVIFDIKDKGEYAELLTTVTDLEEEIQTYYNFEEGSRTQITLRVPSQIKCFCIKDPALSALDSSFTLPQECSEDPLLFRQRLENSGQNYNLFITPSRAFNINKFTLIEPTTNLKPTENPLCLTAGNNVIQARIENKGSYVEIARS